MQSSIHSRPPLSSSEVAWSKRAVARVALWMQRNTPGIYQWYAARENHRWHSEVPFSPLLKPLKQCRVALVNSGGLILDNQQPFNLAVEEGDCSYRVIPGDADPARLVVSHMFYDTHNVELDSGVMLPLAVLNDFAADGKIGSVSPRHFSFSGGIPDPTELIERYAPEVAEAMVSDEVDLAILTPA